MLKEDAAEIDVKMNKIKQGFLIKRSRFLKEWKKRWMVLTRTHLYSFQIRGVYRNPTEKIPLKEISTIKSYYKNQYEKPHIIRIQSDDTHFYLSGTDHQEKWAWMTAIERMTDQIRNPVVNSQNLIRQTLRMSTALRQSSFVFTPRKTMVMPFLQEPSPSVIKNMKLSLSLQVYEQGYWPEGKPFPSSEQIRQQYVYRPQQVFSSASEIDVRNQQPYSSQMIEYTLLRSKEKKEMQAMQTQTQPLSSENKLNDAKIGEKIIQKFVEVKVPVEVQKIIQKIVEIKVPYEVEKIVWKQRSSMSPTKQSPSSEGGSLSELFLELISSKLDDPKPLLDFVAFLGLCGVEKYQKMALQFCCDKDSHRFFAQLLLQALNQQIHEQRLNRYTSLIFILSENQLDYFYSSDLRILIEIVLRELQLCRSDVNQMINLQLIKNMISYHLNAVSHKIHEIRALAHQVVNLGVMQNREIASDICMILN